MIPFTFVTKLLSLKVGERHSFRVGDASGFRVTVRVTVRVRCIPGLEPHSMGCINLWLNMSSNGSMHPVLDPLAPDPDASCPGKDLQRIWIGLAGIQVLTLVLTWNGTSSWPTATFSRLAAMLVRVGQRNIPRISEKKILPKDRRIKDTSYN